MHRLDRAKRHLRRLCGEPASICTAPAVANAIFAACGARVRQIPLTAERIRQAMATGK